VNNIGKRIILIAYYFPPYNVIASQRAAKIALNLVNRGYEIVVLTLDEKYIPPDKLDFEFSKEVYNQSKIEIIKVPLHGIGYENAQNAKLWEKIISGFFSRILLSNGLFWILPLKSKIKELIDSKAGNTFIVSGSPFLSFYLLSREKKRNSQINYTLDYRDLWSDNPRIPGYVWARKVIKNTLEKEAIKYASNILTVSNGCADILKETGDLFFKKVFVVRNLPDTKYKTDFFKTYKNINFSEKKVFVLSGTVYKTCTFSSILQALKKVNPILLSKVEFHYFGTSSKIVVHEFKSYGFENLLINHGYVKKEAAILALNEASILLSFIDDGNSKFDSSVSGLMTTKVFDYFLTNKPILNIGPNGCDINILAEQIGYDNFFSFDGHDISGIKSFLEKFLNDQLKVNKMQSSSLPEFDFDFNKVQFF
jgi:hypothetical protein